MSQYPLIHVRLIENKSYVCIQVEIGMCTKISNVMSCTVFFLLLNASIGNQVEIVYLIEVFNNVVHSAFLSGVEEQKADRRHRLDLVPCHGQCGQELVSKKNVDIRALHCSTLGFT